MTDLIARQGDLTIGPGTTVTLHFSIHLANGEEVDTTRRGKPAKFRVGDGNLAPGFEAALFGLRAGDDERLRITPEEGFGLRKNENIRTIRRADFPNAADLEPGMMMVFDAAGGELPGVVRDRRRGHRGGRLQPSAGGPRTVVRRHHPARRSLTA